MAQTNFEWGRERETVIGYVGPQLGGEDGVTRCVHLYPDMPGGAQYHCATVWEERFPELPFGIGDKMLTDKPLAGSAPTMQNALATQDFQPCPPFVIEVMVKNMPDGSVKHTKKFAGVVGDAESVANRAAQTQGRTAGIPADDVGSMKFSPIPYDDAKNLMGEIASETALIFGEVIDACRRTFGDVKTSDNFWDEVVKAIWYTASKQYMVLRPHYAKEAESADGFNPADSWATILGGTADTFLDDVANCHPKIYDADEAKSLFSKLGVVAAPKDAAGRLALAKRAWILVDLMDRHSVGEAEAIALANKAA